MKFMQKILDRALATKPKDALINEFKLKEGERVVGTLPPELKGLYAVLCEDSDKLKKIKLQVMEDAWAWALAKEVEDMSSKELELALAEIEKKFSGPMLQHETIKEMFWSSVRRAFPKINTENFIGIRKDWQVVARKDGKPEIAGITIPIDLAGLAGRIMRRGF